MKLSPGISPLLLWPVTLCYESRTHMSYLSRTLSQVFIVMSLWERNSAKFRTCLWASTVGICLLSWSPEVDLVESFQRKDPSMLRLMSGAASTARWAQCHTSSPASLGLKAGRAIRTPTRSWQSCLSIVAATMDWCPSQASPFPFPLKKCLCV